MPTDPHIPDQPDPSLSAYIALDVARTLQWFNAEYLSTFTTRARYSVHLDNVTTSSTEVSPVPTTPAHHRVPPTHGLCRSCNTVFTEEDEQEFRFDPDGDPICTSCHDAEVGTCEGCSEMVWISDLEECRPTDGGTRRTQYRCDACRFMCHCCSSHFYGTANYEDGADYCTSCFDDIFTSCCDCGDIVHREHACGSDRDLCESCYGDRESEGEDEDEGGEGVRHSHNYRPYLVFRTPTGTSLGPCPQHVYFGLEIEVEFPAGWGLDSAAPHISEVVGSEDKWYGKYDGSLDNGIELVSHPGTLDYWRKEGFAWTKALRLRKFRSYHTTTCGLHVHVSRNALSKVDWFKVATLFRDNLSLVKRMARRDLNHYCEVARGDTARTICRKVGHSGCYDGSRYEALNFTPRNTVEFRLFKGTLCDKAILRNLECVNAVLEFARRHPLPAMTEHTFLAWLCHQGASTVPSIGPKRADMLRAMLDPNCPASLLERWRSPRSTRPIPAPISSEPEQ